MMGGGHGGCPAGVGGACAGTSPASVSTATFGWPPKCPGPFPIHLISRSELRVTDRRSIPERCPVIHDPVTELHRSPEKPFKSGHSGSSGHQVRNLRHGHTSQPRCASHAYDDRAYPGLPVGPCRSRGGCSGYPPGTGGACQRPMEGFSGRSRREGHEVRLHRIGKVDSVDGVIMWSRRHR